MDIAQIKEWEKRANSARKAAYQILSKHESSVSRVIELEEIIKKLSGLPVDIQDYFFEASKCISHNLLRAAVVLSWAGFFGVLCESLYRKGQAKIRHARPRWIFSNLEELKENYPESQILDTFKDSKLIRKSKLKVYQGQLATRNQCAHPTLYKPSLNSTLGYFDDMVRQTIEVI